MPKTLISAVWHHTCSIWEIHLLQIHSICSCQTPKTRLAHYVSSELELSFSPSLSSDSSYTQHKIHFLVSEKNVGGGNASKRNEKKKVNFPKPIKHSFRLIWHRKVGAICSRVRLFCCYLDSSILGKILRESARLRQRDRGRIRKIAFHEQENFILKTKEISDFLNVERENRERNLVVELLLLTTTMRRIS